jgi:hypothetical protein
MGEIIEFTKVPKNDSAKIRQEVEILYDQEQLGFVLATLERLFETGEVEMIPLCQSFVVLGEIVDQVVPHLDGDEIDEIDGS